MGMDAILISGLAAGRPDGHGRPDRGQTRRLRETPIIRQHGLTADRIPEILKVADGAIVGTGPKGGRHSLGTPSIQIAPDA